MRNLRKSMLSVAAVAVLAAASACGLVGGGAATNAGCVDAPLIYQLSYIPNPQQTGFLYAYDKGYFQAEGVAIEMRPGGPAVNPALQVAQGNVDVAELRLGDALNAVANGAEITLVGQISQQIPLRYISWKDVPLATPADLAGKTVGVQQAGNLALPIKVMMGNAGVSEDAVEIKQIAFDVSDFMARNIDVFPLRTYAHIAMLEEHGVSYPDDVNVLNPVEHGADLPEEGVYVNSAYLAGNSSVVACALRALRAGWRDAAANPAEAKRIVAEYAPAAAFSTEAIDIDVDEALIHVTQNGAGEPVEPLTTDMDYLGQGIRSLQAVGEVPEDIELESMVDLRPLEEAVSKE